MADITKCTQTTCPNAEICYRVQAKDTKGNQSYATFNYTIGPYGLICEHYWKMYETIQTDKT